MSTTDSIAPPPLQRHINKGTFAGAVILSPRYGWVAISTPFRFSFPAQLRVFLQPFRPSRLWPFGLNQPKNLRQNAHLNTRMAKTKILYFAGGIYVEKWFT